MRGSRQANIPRFVRNGMDFLPFGKLEEGTKNLFSRRPFVIVFVFF